MAGKCEWIIADGFMSGTASGDYVSHEAVCVLNTGDIDARIELTVYFQDREPMTGLTATCGARRTNHIRLDRIRAADGAAIPHDVPYAMRVVSNQPVVVQHSRMDVSQPAMTLMTTIAY